MKILNWCLILIGLFSSYILIDNYYNYDNDVSVPINMPFNKRFPVAREMGINFSLEETEEKEIEISEGNIIYQWNKYNETQSLIDFYYSTYGHNWFINYNWLYGDPCENRWYGVSCSYDSYYNITYVSGLFLSSNNIDGYVEDYVLSGLTLIEAIDFTENYISADISIFKNLNKLRLLQLDFNYFYGSLAKFNFNNFQKFFIRNNNVSGLLEINSELRNQPNFYIDLRENDFACPLPEWCSSKGNSLCEPCTHNVTHINIKGSWNQFGSNPHHTSYLDFQTYPYSSIIWYSQVSVSCDYKSRNRAPIISGNTIITSNNGYLTGVNYLNGNIEWQHNYGEDMKEIGVVTTYPYGEIAGFSNGYLKFFSNYTGYVDDYYYNRVNASSDLVYDLPRQSIYFTTLLDTKSNLPPYLMSVNSNNHSLSWKFDIFGESYSSPVVDHDGNIYVCNNEPYCYSLDYRGNKRWEKQLEQDMSQIALTVSNSELFFTTNKDTNSYLNVINTNTVGFYSINLNEFNSDFVPHSNISISVVGASPNSTHSNSTRFLILSGYSRQNGVNRLLCLYERQNSFLYNWEYVSTSYSSYPISAPSISDQYVHFIDNNSVYSLNLQSGYAINNSNLPHAKFNNGDQIAISSTGNLYAFSKNCFLYRLY